MGDGGYVPDLDTGEKNELRDLLTQARDRLADPRFAPLSKEALTLASRAGMVSRDADKRRREEERGQVRFSFQRAGDISFATGEPIR